MEQTSVTIIFATDASVKWHRKHLGDNSIQNFHLGRFIVGFTVENLVLR